MVYLMGIGPGDPELITVKAARLLKKADIVYVPQSSGAGRNARSVADGIVLPYAVQHKIRYVEVNMRHGSKAGTLEIYSRLAEEIALLVKAGKEVVFVSIGDSLLYSTAQYLGRELMARQVPHEYVPGIPAFIAAASHSGVPLAGGRDGLLVTVMPESIAELDELLARSDSLILMKINKRLPLLLDYVRQRKPGTARLLYRIGLDDEAAYDLTEPGEMPEAVGYLSIAILKGADLRS